MKKEKNFLATNINAKNNKVKKITKAEMKKIMPRYLDSLNVLEKSDEDSSEYKMALQEKHFIESDVILSLRGYLHKLIKNYCGKTVCTNIRVEKLGDESEIRYDQNFEELLSVSYETIVRELKNYNPNYALTTFLEPLLLFDLKRFETTEIVGKSSFHYNRLSRIIKNAKKKLFEEQGIQNPDIYQLAEETKMTPRTIENAIEMETCSERINLEIADAANMTESLYTPERAIMKKESDLFFCRLLKNINECEKYVLFMKNGITGQKKMTYIEISFDSNFIKLLKEYFPDVEIGCEDVVSKGQSYENVEYVDPSVVKLIEIKAKRKLRTDPELNERFRLGSGAEIGDAINILDLESIEVDINTIFDDSFDLLEETDLMAAE